MDEAIFQMMAGMRVVYSLSGMEEVPTDTGYYAAYRDSLMIRVEHDNDTSC